MDSWNASWRYATQIYGSCGDFYVRGGIRSVVLRLMAGRRISTHSQDHHEQRAFVDSVDPSRLLAYLERLQNWKRRVTLLIRQ